MISGYFMKASSSKTPNKPITETIVSITDHDRSVSVSDKLKYSLNIQKPESFTCEKSRLPAPIDSTIKLGFTAVPVITGAMMPAAVKPATVAEPTQTLIAAASNQPKINGLIAKPCSCRAIIMLTPLSTKTCFNAPAPATINKMGATSFTASA